MKDFRVLAIFIILYVGLSIAPLLYHSVTIDEFAHIPVGYAQLYYGQYQLESANPPLVRMIYTIPLVIFHPILYWGPHLDTLNYFPYGQYFQETNAAIYQYLAITCRLVVLLLALILGILTFYWAKAEYGYYPAIGVLILYLLNPNILAFGALATTDLGLAFFWVLCLFGFKKYLDKPNWKTVILMGYY